MHFFVCDSTKYHIKVPPSATENKERKPCREVPNSSGGRGGGCQRHGHQHHDHGPSEEAAQILRRPGHHHRSVLKRLPNAKHKVYGVRARKTPVQC